MFDITHYDLQWYVDKIVRGEPFSSLIYGDGEFYVGMGSHTGRKMQYGEIVTKQLEDETRESLTYKHEEILRGTDPILLNYHGYQGRDKVSLHALGQKIVSFLNGFPPIQWVDAVIWENAVRNGQLGPLLAVLQGNCVLVSNTQLINGMKPILGITDTVAVPGNNAFLEIDNIENLLADILRKGPRVCAICMGLGTIPLIIRMLKRSESTGSTFLDLGSNLDVFIKGSSGRGWRNELYSGPVEKYESLIASNLKELK